MQFNIGDARKRWDFLATAVERGEEVILARNGKPVAKIVPHQTITETNRSPGVVPAAAWRVSAVSVQSGYRLAVSFVDGTRGIVDFSRLVGGKNAGIYSALADPALFEQVRLELGVVTWPNGADFDPDWLHEELRTRGEWLVPE